MKSKIIFLAVVLLIVGLVATKAVNGEIKDVFGENKNQAEEPGMMQPFGSIKMPSDPFFDNFEKEMNRMLESFRGMPGMKVPDLTRSMHGFDQGRADVRIEGDDILVLMDLPGHSKESIDLRIRNNELIISSERKSEKSEEEKDKFFRREISYGNFSRVIALPRKVIENKASAVYKDGVLKVTLPIDQARPVNEDGFKIPIN